MRFGPRFAYIKSTYSIFQFVSWFVWQGKRPVLIRFYDWRCFFCQMQPVDWLLPWPKVMAIQIFIWLAFALTEGHGQLHTRTNLWFVRVRRWPNFHLTGLCLDRRSYKSSYVGFALALARRAWAWASSAIALALQVQVQSFALQRDL